MTVDIHYTTGYVTFLGGSGTASDASLKTVPQDANTEDCLQMLRSVSARTYERIDLEPGKSRIGFIAQEVQSAAPQAFGGLIGTSSYSSNRGDAEREILTLDYARLSAVLWQATRSLLARVEALEARLAQKGKERWARWPSKPSAAYQRRTMSGTTKTETARKRGRRYSLSSLCLGMGALTVALLARLLAHKPRCPGASRTQPPFCQAEGRPVQICVDVKVAM